MPERFDPRGLPITDDDATIARALEDVSVPTLLLVDYWAWTKAPDLRDFALE